MTLMALVSLTRTAQSKPSRTPCAEKGNLWLTMGARSTCPHVSSSRASGYVLVYLARAAPRSANRTCQRWVQDAPRGWGAPEAAVQVHLLDAGVPGVQRALVGAHADDDHLRVTGQRAAAGARHASS